MHSGPERNTADQITSLPSPANKEMGIPSFDPFYSFYHGVEHTEITLILSWQGDIFL
jgi:hypothetical protein